jgi:DNA-binding NarL/FixJ family response regulator
MTHRFARVDELRKMYRQWRPFADRMITARRSGLGYEDIAFNAEGKHVIDTIRQKTTGLLEVERLLRDERNIRVTEGVRLFQGETLAAFLALATLVPRVNGIEATGRIKARFPDTIIIGLSVNAAGDNYTAMINAGAARLLTKEAAVDELYQTIRTLLKASSSH